MAGAGNDGHLLELATLASKLLQELDRDLPNFQNKIAPDFIASRTKSVELVNNLKDKIYYVSMGGAGGRLAGAAAGIVGGLSSLFGIAMTLSGKGNGESFIRAGSGLSIMGGATSATATLLELGFTHKYMNEIKQALKDDQELAKTVLPIMTRSRALNLLLMKIFGYSILSENGKTVILVCYECFRILRQGKRSLDNIIEEIEKEGQIGGFNNVINMPEEVVRRVVECLRTLIAHPEMVESYRQIVFLLKGNPQVFELAKFSLQMYLLLRNTAGLDTVANLLSLASPTVTDGALLAQGGFQSVMIALNLVTFLFAARDIQSNKSKYCDLLEQVKEVLAAELRVMTDLQRPAIAT